MNVRALSCRILIVLASFTLAGCPVPIPAGDTEDSRQNVGDTVPEFIVSGKTTRADVLLSLGEPDGASESGMQFTYTRRTSEGGVGFVVAAGNTLGGFGVAAMTYRRLIITFDEAGLVASARLARSSCAEMSAMESQAEPCISMSGQDLLPAPGARFHGQVFAPAGWHPGIRGFDQIMQLHPEPPETPGKLLVGEGSILYFSSNADSESEPLLKIEYSKIADVFVDRLWLRRRLVIKRSDGSYESFTIHRGPGIGTDAWTDAESTEAATQLMKSRMQSAAGH